MGPLPATAVLEHPNDTKLAIRLGMAVNALRAQQHFPLAVADAVGPTGECYQIAAFAQTVAYLREAGVPALARRKLS